MQTAIIEHYPPALKRMEEIRQIAKAEDIEFGKLKAGADGVMRNMFVNTADEYGVGRFEKLLGIIPAATQSLDERKLHILAMMNRRKLSLSELEAMLSNYSEDIKLTPDYREYDLMVEVGKHERSLSTIYDILDEVLPLQVCICFKKEIDAGTELHICGSVSFAQEFNIASEEEL